MGEAQDRAAAGSRVGPRVCPVAFAHFLVPGQGGWSHVGGLADTRVPGMEVCGDRKHESVPVLALRPVTILQAWTETQNGNSYVDQMGPCKVLRGH